ncbi:Myoviridae tail sheath stabiliser [uncultured Caudovirales phage]|uniref:Myoviridae tail sheath stabiliser n=1 Tax=uncultured Caudovirales phage TaxID=2100421 RepID=A0A6J5L3Y6_9CAUD|nr:Myoviridae tail sheath stabiliser [uncultured Caudovirales phage]
MPVQFNYDGQIRRFVIQFIRMMSNFQVEFGQNAEGNRTLQTVPVYYGDVSRQASMILRNNSENALNAVPAMAVYISGLTYDRDRMQNPYHEGTMRVRERTYNTVDQSFEHTQDGVYTVERLMPAPYKLTLKVDIWTSNTEQKHQLLEQITPLFNPGLEIQNTDNYIDWSSLSVALLTDVNYTSRVIPQGGDEQIDVATLTFELPIWISLPAKVKKMGVVAQIIASIYDANGELSPDVITTMQGLMSQQRFTPMNYKIVYIGNTLTLYKENATLYGEEVLGTKVNWDGLVNLYGTLTNGISQARLTFDYPDGPHEIVGTVAYNPNDSTQLLFTPYESTLPANTLDPVDAIIDPMNVTVDSNLLNPATGTRYLILNPIGVLGNESAIVWQGAPGHTLVANANDIIEWNGSYWTVAFNSQDSAVQYVSNLTTTVQYRWSGESWVKSYEGLYTSGYWSLVL